MGRTRGTVVQLESDEATIELEDGSQRTVEVPGEILVEVGLAGKPGVSTRPVTFQLGLVPGQNGRWLVDYWMPRWTPPVPQGQ